MARIDLTDQTEPTWEGAEWRRPGWEQHAVARVDSQLKRHGLVRIGPPVRVRLWSISAVLRLPTDRGFVWYKAVPRLFAHEGRVTSWLGEITPEVVPKVLAHNVGWMLTTDMACGSAPAKGHPLDAIVRVQHATIGRSAAILALGCPDRRPVTALAAMMALAKRADLLDRGQADKLASRLPVLKALVSRVMTLRIPATLVHGDVNGDNSQWTDTGWMHIDWTDACLAHPFVELAQPLLDASDEQRCTIETAFCAAWAGLAPPEHIQSALAAAPAIGAAHQAGTYLSIINDVGPADDHPEMLRLWTGRLIAALSQSLTSNTSY